MERDYGGGEQPPFETICWMGLLGLPDWSLIHKHCEDDGEGSYVKAVDRTF